MDHTRGNSQGRHRTPPLPVNVIPNPVETYGNIEYSQSSNQGNNDNRLVKPQTRVYDPPPIVPIPSPSSSMSMMNGTKSTAITTMPVVHSPPVTQLVTEEPMLLSSSINIIGADESDSGIGLCGWILTAISWGIVAITLPFSLCVCFKVVQEYERAVIFRLGRLLSGGSRGPGLFFVLPCIESYQKVDLRTITLDVPPQEVLTKDSVTVSVDAVVYYRVSNATVSVANVENAHHSTRLLAQTTLRNILGTKMLHEILSDRESISGSMQSNLDEATAAWGIKVERVEIKDARLPVQLQRAMAAEAEAAREARAKVIAAEGEQKASKALRDASDIIAESSSALQLRYLQTLNSISAEKNSTIIFPLPIDFLTHFMGKKDGGSKSGGANRRGNRKTSTSGGGGGGGSNGNKSDCSSDGSIRHKED